MVLNSSGSVVGSQLYGPYGNQRYSAGTLPTSIGFTGQRTDSVTGLDYYVARYYDPIVGAFLSVDLMQGNAQGFDPYNYVKGNPEILTDPTGHTTGLQDPPDLVQDVEQLWNTYQEMDPVARTIIVIPCSADTTPFSA